MTKEELITFLKENLKINIRVWKDEGFYSDGETEIQVTFDVSLGFINPENKEFELIDSDTSRVSIDISHR